MLAIDNAPPTTRYPQHAQHLVLTIESLCDYLSTYIYSFEELQFEPRHFFGAVVKLLSEGDGVDISLALADTAADLYAQAGSYEADEVATYVHLLEVAVEAVAEQIDKLGLSVQDVANLQYFGFRHQKLFLARTVDYDYE